MNSLRTFLIGADAPLSHPKRLTAARVAGWAGAAYLSYAAATYLDLKSGLPVLLCWLLGVVLGAPFVFAFTRPLLAWRLALVTGIVGGLPVQLHHRTPFSWHPALLVAQFVILVVVASRHRAAVSGWAWLSMAALVTISFYPADRIPLMEIVTVLMGAGWLAYRRSANRERSALLGEGPGHLGGVELGGVEVGGVEVGGVELGGVEVGGVEVGGVEVGGRGQA